jgi:hypothetical protein
MPTTPPTTATTTTATTTATTSANISALLFDTEDAQFLPTSTIETKHSSSSSSALRVKSLARNPASIDPLSSTTAPDPQQTMNALKEEIIRLEDQLECASRIREMLLALNKEQENKILKLRHQLDEGRKAEETLKKQCLEKEEQHQIEVNILKRKLEEKDKLLRFQDSSKVLDDILSIQRSPAIKTGLGFNEPVKGESSSQGEARSSKEKSKMINKEIREMKGQSHHQPRKEILQRKSFTPPMNNVECYVCHNLGHVAARYRRRRVQDH